MGSFNDEVIDAIARHIEVKQPEYIRSSHIAIGYSTSEIGQHIGALERGVLSIDGIDIERWNSENSKVGTWKVVYSDD